MAAEVYEDSLELEIGILEAVLPDSGQYLSSAYPYPSLRPTGRVETRQFRTIVLENPYLRATILPDLGGRILRLLDKRTNVEIFPNRSLVADSGGARGAEIPAGIQVLYTKDDRQNALGTTLYQLAPAGDEDESAGVWLGEVGGALSSNTRISMEPDSAVLRIEARIFNRMLGDSPYNGGLAIGMADSKAFVSTVHSVCGRPGFVLHSKRRDCGLSIWCEDSDTFSARSNAERFTLNRFSPKTKFALGARQLDTLTFKLTPHSGLGFIPAACEQMAIEAGSKGCKVQASRNLQGYKLVVLTKDGQSFEVPLDVRPERTMDIAFDRLPSRVVEVVVLNSGGEIVIRHLIGSRFAPLSLHRRVADDSAATQETKNRRALQGVAANAPSFAKLLPTVRYEALLRTAISAKTAVGADGTLEQALLYNAEDHLAWWFKGSLKQNPEEETPEILNAHFLAPLEPMLRAESFLRQSQAQGKSANPLLIPLTELPESFIEAASLLLECNRLSDASRFIDEALRHVELPMLRYLQAYALVIGTSMEIEAAAHVKIALSKAFGPPFPWRAIELTALQRLRQRFPEDERLKQYLGVAERFAG